MRVSVKEAWGSKYGARKRSTVEKFELKWDREKILGERQRKSERNKEVCEKEKEWIKMEKVWSIGNVIRLTHAKVLKTQFGVSSGFWQKVPLLPHHGLKVKTLVKDVTYFPQLLYLGQNSRIFVSREKLVATSDLDRYFLHPKKGQTPQLWQPHKGHIQLTTKTTTQIFSICLLCDYITSLGLKQLAWTNLMDVFRSLVFHLHANGNLSHSSISTSRPGERAETLPPACCFAANNRQWMGSLQTPWC